MKPNPVLRRLGLADDDRLVVIHADDVGMCQATLPAVAELFEYGLVSSGAIMVPCPWFLGAAAYARENPQADLGVHSTLTCEWQVYRWGPVSTRDPASGLLDAEGYFHQSTPAAQEHSNPDAVQRELAAQVECALAAGIRVTHIDTHMGVVAHSRLMAGYLRVALAHRLPPLALRFDEAGWRRLGLGPDDTALAARLVQQLEAQGVPLLDRVLGLPLDQPADQVTLAKRMLDSLPPGLTHLIIHPAVDTPELRAITPDWEGRVANYRAFMHPELRGHIARSGIKVIGYRALQELMPSGG